MVDTRSCPQCKTAIPPGILFCAQCGQALSVGRQEPAAHRRAVLIFWSIGLLFIAAITAGLTMLAPHLIE